MSPPASPRWDASDLLDVQVDHVARETSQDRFADPVGLSGEGLVSRRRFRPALSSHRVTVRADTTVPRTASSWLIRRADHLWVRRQCSMRSTVSALVRAGQWNRALERSSSASVPPWRSRVTHFDTRGTSDTGLGGYVGDGATGLDTHHEPVAALRRQRSVTVGHGSGAFSCRKDDSAPPILTAQDPLPPTPHDYNLMTHNN